MNKSQEVVMKKTNITLLAISTIIGFFLIYIKVMTHTLLIYSNSTIKIGRTLNLEDVNYYYNDILSTSNTIILTINFLLFLILANIIVSMRGVISDLREEKKQSHKLS